MPDLDEVTIGDNMTDQVCVITDAAGVVRDITGQTGRLFLEGAVSGDRPASTGNKVTAASDCVITSGSNQLTRPAGSFVTDGFVLGMLLIGITGIAEGAYIKTIAAGAITMSIPATAASSTVRPIGWFGITGQITAAPAGEITFVGIGQWLDIGALISDVYSGKVRMLDGSNSEVGWTNSARGVVQFKAVQP